MSERTMFKLRRPCPHCPFRTDIEGYLRGGRAREIAESIAAGQMFACHETTDVDPEDDAELVATDESQHCAGALILMEHQGQGNQPVRMAERLGLLDRDRLDMDAPVHRSFMEFVAHHAPEDEDADCCCVVNGGCEAPAGMLVGGFAVPVEATGELHPCPCCGDSVCDSCSNDAGVCDTCVENGYDKL